MTLPHLVDYFNPDGSYGSARRSKGECPGDNRVVPLLRPGRGYVDKMWEIESNGAATGLYGIKITKHEERAKMISRQVQGAAKFPREYKGKTRSNFTWTTTGFLPIGTVRFTTAISADKI